MSLLLPYLLAEFAADPAAPADTIRLTQSDDFDDTRVHVMDDGVLAIDQPSEDGEPNVVVLDRDMVIELVGVLTTWLRATR